MSIDRSTGLAMVTAIKERLEARGVDLRGACGAFQITARVAWAYRDHGARLIVKRPTDNSCKYRGIRYGNDVIGFPDAAGTWIDVLVHTDTDNAPAWCVHFGMDPTLLVYPLDLDANAPPAPAPAPPAPPALEPVDQEQLELLHDDLARIVGGLTAIVETIDTMNTRLKGIDEHGLRLRIR